MQLVADSSGLHGLSESPKFSCSKAFPGGAPLDKTNGCLEHITPTGQDHSLFQLLLSSKPVNRNFGLHRGILAACNSGSQEDCAASSQYAGHLLTKIIFLAHSPKSNVALANPDETKAVVLEPGPERETRVFLADRVLQVCSPPIRLATLSWR
jgi:hypothetical protein